MISTLINTVNIRRMPLAIDKTPRGVSVEQQTLGVGAVIKASDTRRTPSGVQFTILILFRVHLVLVRGVLCGSTKVRCINGQANRRMHACGYY